MDFRNDVLLAEACRADVQKFCRKIEPGGPTHALVLACSVGSELTQLNQHGDQVAAHVSNACVVVAVGRRGAYFDVSPPQPREATAQLPQGRAAPEHHGGQ